MKKILLLTASALLLASCGGKPAAPDYTGEPEVKTTIAPKAASGHLEALSESIGKKTAIGLSLEGGLEANADVTIPANSEAGLPEQTIKVSGKIEELKGKAAISSTVKEASDSELDPEISVLASAEISAKASASFDANMVDYQNVSVGEDGKPVVPMKNVKASLDGASASASIYVEENTMYRAVSLDYKKIFDFASVLASGIGGGSLDSESFSDPTSKVSEPIDSLALGTLAGFPTMASSFITSFAGLIVEETSKTAEESVTGETGIGAILQYLTFKEYVDGTFGITATLDASLISSFAGAVALPGGVSIPEDALKDLKGSLKATLIYSETEIKSLGVSADLSLAMDGQMKANGSVKGGLKAEFSYNSDVQVSRVTDKGSYTPANVDDGGDEL